MLIASPVTGEVIAEVADDSPAEVAEAVAKASRALAELREIPLFERCDRLRRTADALDIGGNTSYPTSPSNTARPSLKQARNWTRPPTACA
jgi:hypothetical protein